MVTEAIKREILRLDSEGKKPKAIVAELRLTRGIVAGILDRHRHKADSVRVQDTPKKPIIQFVPAPERVPNVEEWEGVELTPQLGEFRNELAKLERDNRYVIVEHDHDNHFPYHDPNAQALRSKVRQEIQPDLIVCGSDAFDFPTISRFEPDPRIPMGRVLTRIRPYWRGHVGQLKYDAPKAKEVFVPGNHDARAEEDIAKDKNHDVLMAYHVDTIQANGEVYWLGSGDAALEVIVGNALVVTHGTRANVHTAAATLSAYDNQYSILAGHSHRPDYYTRGTKYKVSASIGGCGCLLQPHYDRRNAHSHWQHSYQFGVVDTLTESAVVNLVEFYHTQDSIWCYVNGTVLSVKKQALEQSEAA